LNEIKSRALAFSRNWADAERVAFLFDLYQRMTSLLPADAGKPKRRVKALSI
jgi:hypothetical protein